MGFCPTLDEIGFYDYIVRKTPNLHRYFLKLANSNETEDMIIDGIGGEIDLGHFAYSTLGYALPTLFPFVPRFWTGWGGDSATLARDISRLRGEVPSFIAQREEYDKLQKEQIYRARLRLGTNAVSSFSLNDLCADSDAIQVGESILKSHKKGIEISLSSILAEYLGSLSWRNRVNNFIKDFDLDISKTYTHDELTAKIYSILDGVLESLAMWPMLGGDSERIDLQAVSDAFSKYILMHR